MRLQIRGVGKRWRNSRQDESKDNPSDGLHGLAPLFLSKMDFSLLALLWCSVVSLSIPKVSMDPIAPCYLLHCIGWARSRSVLGGENGNVRVGGWPHKDYARARANALGRRVRFTGRRAPARAPIGSNGSRGIGQAVPPAAISRVIQRNATMLSSSEPARQEPRSRKVLSTLCQLKIDGRRRLTKRSPNHIQ
jgi:hypothetical protein